MIPVPESLDKMSWERLQYLSFSRSIDANSSGVRTVQVSDDGDFQSYYLGGQYTTLTAEDTDGGACLLSVKIHDNGRHWDIFDNLIPMSLFCTPGRQRASGVAGDPSNPLFEPIEFPYRFMAGTSIRVEYSSSAGYANTIWLVWYGLRILKKFSAPTPQG